MEQTSPTKINIKLNGQYKNANTFTGEQGIESLNDFAKNYLKPYNKRIKMKTDI